MKAKAEISEHSLGTTGNVTAQMTIGSSTATDQGGTVTVNANGSFTYSPPGATFTGTDQFAYRLQNAAGFDDATVTVAVGLRPAGVADARSATGNVRLSTATNLLTNDNGNQLTVTAFDASSTQGGNVSVAANGAFTYNPPPGYEGMDAFNYTAGNGFGNAPAVAVTITVSGMIWFIDNTASAGDGRLTSPFNTLAAFQMVNDGMGNHPAAGDNIFMYDGSGNYTGGVTLLNNQKLIGDGATGDLAAIAGITLAMGSDPLPLFSGTDPVIANAGGNGITVGMSNTIRGLIVGNTPAANAGIIGNGLGTLSITDVSVNGTGQILSFTNGTVNASFNALSTSSTTQSAIVFSNLAGSISDTDAGNSSISGAAGGFDITGPGMTSTVSLTYNGDVTHAGANPLVNVQNHSTGTITFQNGTMSSTNGNLIFVNADGTYNFSGTTNLSTGPRIAISGGSSGNFNFSSNTAVTNPSNVAFDLDGSNATVDYNGSLSSNTAFMLIDIANNTGGSASFDGNLTFTGNAIGIRAQQNTGGTYSFNGSSKTITSGANTAVNLVTNAGAIINFTNGGLVITTTSGMGFSATGGGTVTVQGSTNTINSTTGTALNVASTTIGASGLTFQSISKNGGVNGIVLNNTGSSGGLTISGDGGGSNNGSGGTIQNTTGVGVVIDNSMSVSFGYLNITNCGTDCVTINNINGLTFNRCNISDGSGVAQDRAIEIGNFSTGTAVNGNITFTNNVFGPASGNAPHDLLAMGVSSGTSVWNITGTTFRNTGNSGINCELRGTAVFTSLTVTSCSFAGAGGLISARGVFVNNLDDSVIGLATIQTSTFTNNNIHIDMNQQNDTDPVGSHTFNIVDNTTMTGARSHAMNIFAATGAFGGTFTGTINGNIIGNAGVANSGSEIGNGIRVNINGGSDATMLLNNNTIRQTPNGRGIEVICRNGTGGLDITVTNNNVNPQALSDPLAAILLQSNCLTTCNTLRADIRGNTVPSGTDVTDLLTTYLQIIESSTSTFELVDTTAPISGTCASELAATNTGSTGVLGGCALIAGPISVP